MSILYCQRKRSKSFLFIFQETLKQHFISIVSYPPHMVWYHSRHIHLSQPFLMYQTRRCPVLCSPFLVLAIPTVLKKAFNIPLVHFLKEITEKFCTYTQPSSPTKVVISFSSWTRVSSPPFFFSKIEEPLDDTSPHSSLSLGMHHHDNLMFYNNSTLNNSYVEESGSDCIVVTPILIKVNLFLHSQYQIIHCYNKIRSGKCDTAQLPYAIAGHLQSQHQYIFKMRKEKKTLEAYIMILNLVMDTKVFINSESGLASVKGFKMEKSFCCKKHLYAVYFWKSMTNHWSDIHKGQARYIPETALVEWLSIALFHCADKLRLSWQWQHQLRMRLGKLRW